MKYFIGIDIGGTKCAVTVAQAENGEIKDKTAFATNQPLGWKNAVENICLAVENIMEKNGIENGDVLACGISCGGPLDSKKGVIMCPPNLPDWDGVPVCGIITERFGFPAFLQNDANACAIAEWRYGAGRGCDNMIFLTFGTGMGAGLILNGSLYSGTNDMAGEAGHIRLEKSGPVGYGKAGSFEGFCSGGGIARTAKAKALEWLKSGKTSAAFKDEADIENITAKSLALCAAEGDAFGTEVYSECGEKLGSALAVLIDILNPQKIVIGSIFARSGSLLRESMEASLRREALPQALSVCEIVPAQLGESIGDYAAIGVAQNGYERIG